VRDDGTEVGPPPKLAPVPDDGRPRPRVTVVMPTYKRAAIIGQTVRSILAQTFTDFELLVRDDGGEAHASRDAVAAAANRDPRVRYHLNPKNLRMPENLNDGIRESRGELIAVCHDHDLFAPRFLEVLVGLLDRHPTALYAHAGIEGVDHDGVPNGWRDVTPWEPLTRGDVWLERMLKTFGSLVCALTLVRRSAHERHGLYHPAYGFIADVEMWMRLAEAGDVAYSPEPLVRVREREDGHFADVDPWPHWASIFAIHRRYVRRVYRGAERLRHELALDLRADSLVLRAALQSLRRGQLPRPGPSRARLAQAAGPFGRVFARLAP
jgi:glycosyltransferase involved in cell wall biosynthesis